MRPSGTRQQQRAWLRKLVSVSLSVCSTTVRYQSSLHTRGGKYKYIKCASTIIIFQVSVLYGSIKILVYTNILLSTNNLSKQASNFCFNAFEENYLLFFVFCIIKHQLPNIIVLTLVLPLFLSHFYLQFYLKESNNNIKLSLYSPY